MISLEVTDSVAVVTLDRPARKNALSLELLEQLRGALTDARDERAIVVHGAGDTFSSGGDLHSLHGDERDLRVDEAIAATTEAIRETSGPVIAAIEGGCIGAAVDLALACDIRVGDPTVYCAVPAVRFGLLYNPESILNMSKTVTAAGMVRLLLLGERLEARDALSAGLLTHLVEPGRTVETALAMAQRVASWPRAAAEATRGLLARSRRSGAVDLERWNRQYAEIISSPDRARAIATAQRTLAARHASS